MTAVGQKDDGCGHFSVLKALQQVDSIASICDRVKQSLMRNTGK